MQIQDMKMNGVKNPVGFYLDNVICSWKVTDTKSRKQANAKIEVSTDEGFGKILYTKEGAELKQQYNNFTMSQSFLQKFFNKRVLYFPHNF